MPQEQAVQIMSTGLALGFGAILGAICATIVFCLSIALMARIMRIKNAVDDYRELREERREKKEEHQWR